MQLDQVSGKLEYDFPVFGTQGGGLVREMNGEYVFVEAPTQFPELTVGSKLPEMWDIAPANRLAREAVVREQFPPCPYEHCDCFGSSGRVGPSGIGRSFYCYECHGTFD